MSINLKLLGEKLKKFRVHLKLEVGEVSQQTEIAANDLQSYESGLKLPTGDHILILSMIYKCDYQFFISSEKVADFERVETLYRSLGNETSKTDRIAIQEFLYLCECEEFLLSELKLKKQYISFE